MENNNNTTQDCGCNDGDCCQPKRKPKWRMFLSILLLLAALGIVAFKVVSMNNAPAPVAGASACDTAAKAGCDTTKGSSCCPKQGN
jgi:hypothetical protein